MKIKIQSALMLSILLISAIGPALADEGMMSDIICPCECAMAISSCDCSTAIQVKKEITQMKNNGFSEKQIFSALQAEYGTEILVHPEKAISSSLTIAGVSLIILFVFLGYIFSKKTKTDIIPDLKKYEQQFEEEYRNFVSEIEESAESGKNVNHIPENTPGKEDKW